jgi:hypothetical protein
MLAVRRNFQAETFVLPSLLKEALKELKATPEKPDGALALMAPLTGGCSGREKLTIACLSWSSPFPRVSRQG